MVSTIARYLLGLIFLTFGLNGFLHFIPLPPPTWIAGQFLGAIFVSRLYVVLFLLQIVPALLLLANRYVPLALTILGAIVFQYSVHPHFHGACRLASGFVRHDLVVSYSLECPILFCADSSTLSNSRNATRRSGTKGGHHEAITRMDSQVTYDNEAIVRNAYHTAEGNVLDIPGWIASFTEDGV